MWQLIYHILGGKNLHFSNIFIQVNKFPPCCSSSTHVYDIYERSTKLVGTVYKHWSISETTLSSTLTHFVFKKRGQDKQMSEK